ncbi:MAG: hypothetical protein OEZ58_22700, partial [Gammaproteobacteria bacterium]|nr:hypothetical protein [Gammaproteobacteria bacterium]
MAQNSSVSIAGDLVNSGTFSEGNSTVILNGTGVQSITTGASNFYDVSITNATDIVTFADGFSANDFTAITPSSSLKFVGGGTFTISGTLNINGQATGTKVILNSTNTTAFVFDVTGGPQSLTYVDVQYSNASTNNIVANASTNSGNNDDGAASPHWIFPTNTRIVTNTLDWDPAVDIPPYTIAGSLRDALNNAVAGDSIIFDTTVFDPSAPATITLLANLADIIVDNITIDASNAGVVLSGSAQAFKTITFNSAGGGHVLRGMRITQARNDGVKIRAGTGTVIGGNRNIGSGPYGQGNQFDSNRDSGVKAQSDSNFIYGNLLGTDGTNNLGNLKYGALVQGTLNIVGSAVDGYENIISGNQLGGILINNVNTNTIVGNHIGINDAGTAAIPNELYGIYIKNAASGNIIGGTTAAEANIISGNNGDGIFQDSTGTNTLLRNYIGTNASSDALPNTGDAVENNSLTGTITLGDGLVIGTNTGVGVNLVTGVIGFAGTVDINDDVALAAASTTNMGSSTIYVAGNWTDSATTLNSATSSLIFDGASDQTFTTNSAIFNNITLNNTGTDGTADNLIISGALDVNGNLVLTDGDLDLGTNNPAVNTNANVTIDTNASINVSARTASWTFDGTSIFTDNSAAVQDIGPAILNGTSVTLASDLKAKSFTITAGTLDLTSNGYTFTLTGTGTPLVITDTLSVGTNSTVAYTGSGGAVNITTTAYVNLNIGPAAAATTYTLTGHLTAGNSAKIAGNLTLGTNAELDTSASDFDIDLDGDWINSGGSLTANLSTVSMTGTNQTISGSTTFKHFTKTVAAADTLNWGAGDTQPFA